MLHLPSSSDRLLLFDFVSDPVSAIFSFLEGLGSQQLCCLSKTANKAENEAQILGPGSVHFRTVHSLRPLHLRRGVTEYSGQVRNPRTFHYMYIYVQLVIPFLSFSVDTFP